ncbi:NUDIX domain-containing protein [Paenibacillus albiflavus]|uniref:NUDIX domain-containing protein n=1 Tax=Paenibacillus albiflavus TaxID=2545760 RepID=A0A4R4EJK2_9BACL|nr:NUDIX domain-containing protein [Paenibacillus albiflavus]TCZ79897.1 NUDIX domain-containing protein [Paenibacillus albiflavus]
MAKKEWLDVFSPEMVHIGIKSRDEIHRDGLWHHTFQCWLLFKEEGKDYILFQRRHPDKKDYPNLLDITAAGHLDAGEGPADGVRELKEELGIDVSIDKLISIGMVPNVIMTDQIKDREFSHVYVYPYQGQISELQLQDDEVASIIRIEVNAFRSFVQGQLHVITGYEYETDQMTIKQILLKHDDFVPHPEEYILFLMKEIDQIIDTR